MLIPMRRAKPGKGGDEIDVAVVFHTGGELFDFCGVLEKAEAIPQPLCYRTGDEDAAFECELRAATDAPSDGAEQIVFRYNRLRACLHEHETTRAIGVLHHAGACAALAEEGGLLVARNAGNGYSAAKQIGFAQDFTRAAHLG